MSTSSAVSLGALRLAAQEASDFENNTAISTEAWNQFISQSYKRLYDMLVAAYGNSYYIANTWQFTATSSQLYALPDGTPSFTDTTGAVAAKFYKLIGLDLQYSSSPTGWLTLRNLNFIERNKFATPNTATNWVGYTNLRYAIQGNNIFIAPTPSNGQLFQAWYVPAPTSLQYRLPAYSVVSSNILGSITDTTGIVAGMNITANFTTGIIPANTTVTSVSTTTITMSSNALSAQSPFIFSAWSDATSIEGISGWEQFVIVDAARKAMTKTEFDATPMAAERDAMMQEIQAMAEARDAGQAFHVADALGANAWPYDESNGLSGPGYDW